MVGRFNMTDKLKIYKELSEEIKKCSLCDLCNDGNLLDGFDPHVLPQGNVNAKIMFIGESPNFDDTKLGRPIMPPSKSGQVYERILKYIGFSREQVWTSNIVLCRPPKNREPDPLELYKCVGYLERQLKMIKPELVITFGKLAAGCFLGNISMTKDHGKIHHSKRFDIDVFVLYHTAYASAYAAAEKKKEFKEDIKELKTILNKKGIIDGKYTYSGGFRTC